MPTRLTASCDGGPGEFVFDGPAGADDGENARGDDFVGFLRHRNPPQRRSRLGREGAGHMERRRPGRPVEGATRRLAVDRDNSFRLGHRRRTFGKASETGRKRPRVQKSENAANVSWLGNPFSNRRNCRNTSSFISEKSAKSTRLAAPHTDPAKAIVSASNKSCRVALPLRGSGTSSKQSANHPVVPSSSRGRYGNPSQAPASPTRFRCDSPGASVDRPSGKEPISSTSALSFPGIASSLIVAPSRTITPPDSPRAGSAGHRWRRRWSSRAASRR